VNVVTHKFSRLLVLTLLCLAFNVHVHADDQCEHGVSLTHAFDSGAAWSACAVLDDLHGLELQQLRYRAPGDIERSVIDSLHAAQILMHYHNANEAVAQIGIPIQGDEGMGGASALKYDEQSCSGDILSIQTYEAVLCTTEVETGILAKFATRDALHGSRWQIEAAAQRGTLVWSTAISLHEHGVITPEINLSGVGSVFDADNNLVPATIVTSWRTVFALDAEAGDQAEEFDFALRNDLGNRRPLQVATLATETLRKVDRKAFRGWRVRDAESGRGYYLDPANSGYAYTSRTLNWPQFDVAFTRSKDCEQHALHNDQTCGRSLDNFINGENLGDSVTLWHQQSRVWQPRQEDSPVISSISLNFDLLPFEWTAQSPFNVGQP